MRKNLTAVLALAFAAAACDSKPPPAPPAPVKKKASDPEVVREMRAAVRSGFQDEAAVVAMFAEERYEPGELDPAEVKAAVSKEFAALREERKTWPAETDCDRLTQVFKALAGRGVIALENAGYTQSDGQDDVAQAFDSAPDKSKLTGYCFYHGQDVERAVNGEGLHLSFGALDPEKEESQGPLVGKIVVEELEKRGLKTVWDSTFQTRIHIPKFDWKRRS